jgi:hypothetical protein
MATVNVADWADAVAGMAYDQVTHRTTKGHRFNSFHGNYIEDASNVLY